MYLNDTFFANVKATLVFIFLFAVIMLFIIKNIQTFNRGFATEEKIEQMRVENAQLKEQNERADYNYRLYLTQRESSIQARILENKKREGETIYYVIVEENPIDQENVSFVEDSHSPPKKEKPYWQKWLELLF